MNMVARNELLAAAEAAERAASAVTPEEHMAAVMEVFRHKEALRIGLMQTRLGRLSQSPHAQEALPLMESGDEIGRIVARIPKDECFHLMQQENFGADGFYDAGGLEDYLKDRPACRVKTVSGKVVVGWRGEPARGRTGERPRAGAVPVRTSGRRGGVIFGRGTLQLAS
jgi:hypothetical protein